MDQSTVPYLGWHGAKMFIRGKPVHFGFKIWCLCGSDGYPYNIKVYQKNEKKLQDQPLGSHVISNKVDVITANSSALLHELYFDNFFTSYSLMSDLAKIASDWHDKRKQDSRHPSKDDQLKTASKIGAWMF